jgi:CDP-glucose 4,6-dehydratase
MGECSAEFWQGRRVFLTGHTGFKGGWLTLLLERLGARVFGYSLDTESAESLYDLAGLRASTGGVIADICDASHLRSAVDQARPDVVIHLAAQALVRRSYRDPDRTWQTNVMGTLALLQAFHALETIPLTLIVTTDKVYRNDESGRPLRETDPLGGHDPYSASKAACELLVESWRESFSAKARSRIVSARAGNVIGGGDFAQDRIVPDLWRAMRAGRPPVLRNPASTRPWQHVLDCLNGYLLYLEALADGRDLPPTMNFGPQAHNVRTVAEIADSMLTALDLPRDWEQPTGSGPREMALLALDTRLARERLAWRDQLDAEHIVSWTADWYRALYRGEDMRKMTLFQIETFLNLAGRLP